MHIFRMIMWVLLLAVLLIFSINNWNPVELRIWEGLVLETKVPALVVVAFLIGLVPMWLVHRTTKWQLNRRISSLESAARMAAMAQVAPEESVPAPVGPQTVTAAPTAPAPQAETPATDPTTASEIGPR